MKKLLFLLGAFIIGGCIMVGCQDKADAVFVLTIENFPTTYDFTVKSNNTLNVIDGLIKYDEQTQKESWERKIEDKTKKLSEQEYQDIMSLAKFIDESAEFRTPMIMGIDGYTVALNYNGKDYRIAYRLPEFLSERQQVDPSLDISYYPEAEALRQLADLLISYSPVSIDSEQFLN